MTTRIVALVAFAAVAGAAPAQTHGTSLHTLMLFDQIELRKAGGGDALAFDFLGWAGGDISRVWVRSSLSRSGTGDDTDFVADAFYGRLVAPFWDALIGVGVEQRRAGDNVHTRSRLVLGLEGLAPYWFEVEPSLVFTDDGDVGIELESALDLYLTQRLVLQPKGELHAGTHSANRFGAGSGLREASAELRLRYELRREFAPYIGVTRTSLFGRSADVARAAGERASLTAVIGGVRLWF